MMHRNRIILISFNVIDIHMLRCNIIADTRSLEMQGMRSKERRRNSIAPKGELASRTLAMPAVQSQGGHLWRLDHGADGFGRENVGDPACRRACGDSFRFKHHL